MGCVGLCGFCFAEQKNKRHKKLLQNAFLLGVGKESISDIENSDFYKSDAYDKLEQFSAYEENINKELEENLKIQKEIEEQLKQNTQENNKENNENFNKEKVNPKDKEDLEKELK